LHTRIIGLYPQVCYFYLIKTTYSSKLVCKAVSPKGLREGARRNAGKEDGGGHERKRAGGLREGVGRKAGEEDGGGHERKRAGGSKGRGEEEGRGEEFLGEGMRGKGQEA
jgi:hypothetical protein